MLGFCDLVGVGFAPLSKKLVVKESYGFLKMIFYLPKLIYFKGV